jgi:hypothetical protein
MRFVLSLINSVRQTVGLFIPLLRQATDFAGWGRWAKVTLGVLAFAALMVLLAWINQNDRTNGWLMPWLRRRASDYPVILNYFLPILAALLIALTWVLYLIYQQLGLETDADRFPDITAAWAAGVERLARKDFHLQQLPLFLVLGRNQAGDAALFAAGKIDVQTFGPAGDAPLRLWASPTAIFVTAPEASALGACADALAGGAAAGGESAPAFDPFKTMAPIDQTLGPDDGLGDPVRGEMEAILRIKERGVLTAGQEARLKELNRMLDVQPAKPVALSAAEVATASDRLRHLCRLMVRDRAPYCPANGIVALVPWKATESDEGVDNAQRALRADLRTAREALGLCCPTAALVCDLEEARGFRAFRDGFSGNQLAKRLGKGLPLVPEYPAGEYPALVERVQQWVGESLFPGRVYLSLKLETAGPKGRNARELFHLYRSAWERLPRLGKLLRNGLTGAAPADEPLLFAGCYFAGTGRDEADQAFLPGFFDRMTNTEDRGGALASSVAWTGPARAEDRAATRKALAIVFGVLTLAAAVIALAAWRFG